MLINTRGSGWPIELAPSSEVIWTCPIYKCAQEIVQFMYLCHISLIQQKRCVFLLWTKQVPETHAEQGLALIPKEHTIQMAANNLTIM